MKYLGIDYGTRKVGLAFSDDAGTMGFPHSVVPNDGHLRTTVLDLIRKEGAGAIVMGESKNYAGEENPVAAHARSFGEMLSREAGIPLYMEAEVLTTQEARRFPDGERMPGNPLVDAAAAALILTQYLSHDHA